MTDSPNPYEKLAQVAIVVRDIDQAIKQFQAILGLKASDVMTTDPGLERNQLHMEKPSDAQAKLAFINLQNIQLELIEPLGGESVWQSVLDERGPCIHHIAFWVNGIEHRIASLAGHGIDTVQIADMGDHGKYAYCDATEQLGALIALLDKGEPTE